MWHTFDHNWLSVQEALVLARVLREVYIPQPLANPDMRSTTEQSVLPKADEAHAELVAAATASFHVPITSGSPHLSRFACFA